MYIYKGDIRYKPNCGSMDQFWIQEKFLAGLKPSPVRNLIGGLKMQNVLKRRNLYLEGFQVF